MDHWKRHSRAETRSPKSLHGAWYQSGHGFGWNNQPRNNDALLGEAIEGALFHVKRHPQIAVPQIFGGKSARAENIRHNGRFAHNGHGGDPSTQRGSSFCSPAECRFRTNRSAASIADHGRVTDSFSYGYRSVNPALAGGQQP